MEFKDKMLKLLGEKRLSQREFAKLIGVQESTVGKWIYGFHFPSEKIRNKICDVLGCTYSYLFSNDEIKDTNIDGTDVVHIGDLTDAQKATIKAIIEDLRKANKN